jgi:hypothetical protein
LVLLSLRASDGRSRINSMRIRDILVGLFAGALGGAVVDLIYISFAGPSALFSSIIGLTQRYQVFLGHLFLGGIFGILFMIILEKLVRFNLNVWIFGIFWGLFCMGLLGGMPSLFTHYLISAKIVVFSLMVWFLYGLILAASAKLLINKSK